MSHSRPHPVRVFEIDRCRVLGPDGHIVAPGDYLLHDTLWKDASGAPPLSKVAALRRRRPFPRRHLPGRTALIASDWSTGGYGHFLTDALPRWFALREAGLALADFQNVLVYHPSTDVTKLLIREAGLGDKVLRASPYVDYDCDSLVATSFPHPTPAYSARLLGQVRDLQAPGEPRRLVYLSRRGISRHPANAEELEAIFRSRSFETISPDDHLGAVRACREARVIVGVEGANLFNTVFAPPGARVVVLLWPECGPPYLTGLGRALDHPTAIVGHLDGCTAASPRFSPAHVAAAIDWSLT